MSQYGGNKSAPPPWAQTPAMLQRPTYSEAGSSSIRAPPITYQTTPQPLGQQTLLQQPGLAPAMLMQQQIQQPAQVPYGLQFQAAQQQALLSQAGSALGAPGIALPTTLASSQPVMTVGSGPVAYPAGRSLGHSATGGYQQLLQQQQQQQQQPKQRVFTGTITKLHDNFGFVDEDVFFQTNCIRGTLPKVGERVLVEAQYNANMPFKWNATRIQLLPNQSSASTSSGAGGGSSAASAGTGSGGGASTGARTQALLTRGPPGVVASKAAAAGAYGSVPPPSDQMPQSGSSLFGGANRLPHSGRPRSPIRRVRAASREKERRRSRDREESSSSRRRSRSRSPRRRSRPIPRYNVHVPKVTLDMSEASVLTLKKRYNNLYVPSDFFTSRFLVGNTFPLHRPFQLATPVSYHVMSREVDPVVENDSVYEPPDLDYRFCAKVMLLTTPTLEDLYRRTTSLAELGDDVDDLVHPSRLVSFLVGLRGKNETMAIGGPWSPGKDGADPEGDPQVLIRTAIRTCRALTGIDLSQCTKWYRMAEIFYRRGDKSTETVVLFLPDTTALLPSRVAWEKLQATYRQALQAKLNPAAAAQDEKDDEDDGVILKQEPTNWSELDPRNMKVSELKMELELRSLSPKGLKSQLIARLTKVLKTEEEKEAEEGTGGAAKAKATPTTAPTPAPIVIVDEPEKPEDEETRRRDDADRRSLEKKYQLPDTPQVIVHPHRTAKSGKFDCTVMSLSVLLDYRPEDNKEHSFEVSLFAEVFNEMLMRDAGFAIYRALVEAPEKVKEDKKNKDKKEDDKKDGDDEKKKEEKGTKKEEAEDKKEEDDDSSGDGSMYTADKRLLMAFSYFDTSLSGYFVDRDLEDILQTVGLGISRAQVRRLVSKAAVRDTVPYRRLTDRPTPPDGSGPAADAPPADEPQLRALAAGNWEHLPAFARPGRAAEGDGKVVAEEGEEGKPVMVTFEGSLVDLSSLMARVRRADSTLQQTEQRMSQLQDEVRSAQDEASDLRREVKTLDHQLQLSRASVTSLESQLSTSQETVGKYGTALDAVYAAVAPLVAEAENRTAQQLRDEQEAAAEHQGEQEATEEMETEQPTDGDSTREDAKEDKTAKGDAKEDKTAKGDAKEEKSSKGDAKEGKSSKEDSKEDNSKGDADVKVKEETPEPKVAKEATPKATKRTRSVGTPDSSAKKAKVENGSSA